MAEDDLGKKEVGAEKNQPVAKVKVDKKELKKQIRAIKSEKNQLLQGKDKKALSRIRKKIKRLKRLTKKAA